MSTDKESSAAGTDNRPSMLVESDYELWKIRIERYIRGKPLGKLIWRSIQNEPTPHPQITVTKGQGAAAVQVIRDKTDEEFTEIENNRELADIQATNILSTKGTQSYGQVIDNKGKFVICCNCRGEGHVSRQCKEEKRVKDSQYFKDKMLLREAKEKGEVLDAKAKAFLVDVECTAPYDQPLAITPTNIFEVSLEDAYVYDVDEGPHATAVKPA
nr:hypothetical protein [Tanacetum cinerariifolium]